MGTTLENGVYLPSEGERNCYAGLKTNWEILDQKVADVTALQQAVAGALHREIVESLPTTDIDPNTIYMILSGTSASENVYNEFMYVNNAWELIGTSATDLTNYYTKAEVDGKLLLKASASDLTSHTGDTTIHVTASDKTKWDTVALIKQLRLVNTQVGSATTIAFANIDDTNGIKVGDKCMDLDAKMFEITAVDTTNQTVTVGSALIDLAKDSDVVHTSGNENVAGIKHFTNDTYVKNINFTKEVASTSSSTTSILQLINTVTYTDQTADKVAILNFRVTADGAKAFYPNENNQYSLGLQSRKWSEVRAIQYYYGSSDTEFSQKFVTTDTDQTVGGNKTFSSCISSDGSYLGNESSGNERTNLCLRANRDTAGQSGAYIGRFRQNRAQGEMSGSEVSFITFDFLENSIRYTRCFTMGLTDWDSEGVPQTYYLTAPNGKGSLGTSFQKWSTINGLEPSALSMPDLANGIDISSYITTGDTDNNYTPSVNGWIWIRLIGNGASIVQGDFGINSSYVTNNLTSEKWVEANLFVTKNVQSIIRCRGITGIVSAYFYPCLGNV